MLAILSDYSERIEGAMQKGREAADRIVSSTERIVRARDPQEPRLSDVSLPNLFLDEAGTGEFLFSTPESKKATEVPPSGSRSPKKTPPSRTARRLE